MNRLILVIILLAISATTFAQKDKNDKKDDKKNKGKVVQANTKTPDKPAAPKPTNAATEFVSFKTDTLIKLKESPKIEVTELLEYMSQGQKQGLKVLIPSGNTAAIEKDWKSYLKTLKGKTKKGKEEYFTDNALVSTLSANPIDIYSRIDETANGTNLKVFFDLGGAFLSSKANPEKYPFGETIVRDFAAQQALKGLNSRLENEEGKLSRLAEARKNIETEQQTLELDIERMKETIRQHELTLEKNKTAKLQVDTELQKQITAVEQLKKDIKAIGTGNK